VEASAGIAPELRRKGSTSATAVDRRHVGSTTGRQREPARFTATRSLSALALGLKESRIEQVSTA